MDFKRLSTVFPLLLTIILTSFLSSKAYSGKFLSCKDRNKEWKDIMSEVTKYALTDNPIMGTLDMISLGYASKGTKWAVNKATRAWKCSKVQKNWRSCQARPIVTYELFDKKKRIITSPLCKKINGFRSCLKDDANFFLNGKYNFTSLGQLRGKGICDGKCENRAQAALGTVDCANDLSQCSTKHKQMKLKGGRTIKRKLKNWKLGESPKETIKKELCKIAKKKNVEYPKFKNVKLYFQSRGPDSCGAGTILPVKWLGGKKGLSFSCKPNIKIPTCKKGEVLRGSKCKKQCSWNKKWSRKKKKCIKIKCNKGRVLQKIRGKSRSFARCEKKRKCECNEKYIKKTNSCKKSKSRKFKCKKGSYCNCKKRRCTSYCKKGFIFDPKWRPIKPKFGDQAPNCRPKCKRGWTWNNGRGKCVNISNPNACPKNHRLDRWTRKCKRFKMD